MNTFNINTQSKDKRNSTMKKNPISISQIIKFSAGGKKGKPFSYGHSEKLYKTQYNSMQKKKMKISFV